MKMATRANLPGKVHPPIRFADICPHSWSQDELEPIPSRPIGVKDGPDLLFFASTCLFTSFLLFFLLNFSHLLFPSFLFELSTSFLPYLISLLTFIPSFLQHFLPSYLLFIYLFFVNHCLLPLLKATFLPSFLLYRSNAIIHFLCS